MPRPLEAEFADGVGGTTLLQLQMMFEPKKLGVQLARSYRFNS
jgi:hypothetical protein